MHPNAILHEIRQLHILNRPTAVKEVDMFARNVAIKLRRTRFQNF